ncbi:MAG: DUF4166 domain-containing protein [Acidobacteria bacterium]|nr:DUF4166 domain-containing protein [Acidobacteriota bacterium]
MKTFSPAQQTASLYPRIVGPAWANLSEPVKRLHIGALLGAGKFTVRHGERGPARLLTKLLGLPAAGVDIPVKLSVTTHKSGERWQRTFGAGTLFVTEQRAGRESGLMIERIGPTEVRYRLEIAGGALFYRHTGTKLCIGPLRLPLPRWLAPRIAARESAIDEKSTHISVEVTLPVIGRLISYKGFIEIKDKA